MQWSAELLKLNAIFFKNGRSQIKPTKKLTYIKGLRAALKTIDAKHSDLYSWMAKTDQTFVFTPEIDHIEKDMQRSHIKPLIRRWFKVQAIDSKRYEIWNNQGWDKCSSCWCWLLDCKRSIKQLNWRLWVYLGADRINILAFHLTHYVTPQISFLISPWSALVKRIWLEPHNGSSAFGASVRIIAVVMRAWNRRWDSFGLMRCPRML